MFPALNVAVIGGSLAGPRIAGRVGVRTALLGGMATITAGAAVLLALPAAGLPVGTMVTSFAVMGAGLGVASVASTAAGTGRVPAGDQGVAAGLLNSTAQLGTALGLAAVVPLVASAPPMLGYRLGFAASAAIALAGAVCALTVRG